MIRPQLWRAYLIFVALHQLLVVAWLIGHGWGLQMLAATVVGVLLGRSLRPLTLRRRWMFLPLGLAVLLAELQLSSPAWMLLDQVFKALLIVSTWPDDPSSKVRRRISAAVRFRRRWSVGIPVVRG